MTQLEEGSARSSAGIHFTCRRSRGGGRRRARGVRARAAPPARGDGPARRHGGAVDHGKDAQADGRAAGRVVEKVCVAADPYSAFCRDLGVQARSLGRGRTQGPGHDYALSFRVVLPVALAGILWPGITPRCSLETCLLLHERPRPISSSTLPLQTKRSCRALRGDLALALHLGFAADGERDGDPVAAVPAHGRTESEQLGLAPRVLDLLAARLLLAPCRDLLVDELDKHKSTRRGRRRRRSQEVRITARPAQRTSRGWRVPARSSSCDGRVAPVHLLSRRRRDRGDERF
jgi:hypothetical protein